MGLETATFISGLNVNNPVGATDPKSQGDDHLRLIKSTLLNTFPNISGAMNASHGELNNLVGVTGKTGTGNLVLSASPTFTGVITGPGSGLTALNASNLSSGSVPDARIPASNVTQHVASINHDALLNFVANEHINHGSVSITAGNGLSGGGLITASRTLTVGQGDGISVAATTVGVDATVIRTTGNQTIGGIKTFSSDISMTGTRAIDATTRLNLTGSTVSCGENGGSLGFYGSAGASKPGVGGNRNGNSALQSLLIQLANLGLITDNSTDV